MRALILALIDARLAFERGYLAAYTLRNDAVKAERHRYVAIALESLRKAIEEEKDQP